MLSLTAVMPASTIPAAMLLVIPHPVDFVHRFGIRSYSLTCRGSPHDVAVAVHKQLIGSTDEI